MANMTKASKEGKFTKFVKFPLRMLIKARDLYVKSMTECSGRFDYGIAMGCPNQMPSTLPRSFSTSSITSSSSNNEDYSELVRAASLRSALANTKIEFDHARKAQSPKQSPVAGVPKNVPRSRSVGIGRIDEDKACEFHEEDFEVKRDVYPRSRSYAVSRRTIMS